MRRGRKEGTKEGRKEGRNEGGQVAQCSQMLAVIGVLLFQ